MVMRGKAEPGDKTMCDARWPVVESLGQSAQQNLSVAEALQRAADSAERAVESTITMQARKGGPVTGERSVGHRDPGATSVMLMMKTLAEVAGS